MFGPKIEGKQCDAKPHDFCQLSLFARNQLLISIYEDMIPIRSCTCTATKCLISRENLFHEIQFAKDEVL